MLVSSVLVRWALGSHRYLSTTVIRYLHTQMIGGNQAPRQTLFNVPRSSLVCNFLKESSTDCSLRSENTQARARKAGVNLAPSIESLVSSCSAIFSIVPPRDAKKTAQRIVSALSPAPGSRKSPLYYVDMNAISPNSAVEINALLSVNPNVRHLDGGIIGGVPYSKERGADGKPEWHCPSFILSGPHEIPDSALSAALNVHHLDLRIGSATGLKMCFACTTKGFVSLAIQSFTTAQELGVLGELREYLQRYNPSTLTLAEKGLVTMAPKAYRWVHEMMEIADTMAENGGFEKGL